MPDWIGQALSALAVLGAAIIGLLGVLRKSREDLARAHADGERSLREDLFTETRSLRGDVDKLYDDLQRERADRHAESTKQNLEIARARAELDAANKERRELALKLTTVQSHLLTAEAEIRDMRANLNVSEARLQRLLEIMSALAQAGYELHPSAWSEIVATVVANFEEATTLFNINGGK